MKKLFQKLRKFEIQIRKAVNSQMQGDFHSVFKGSGLEFDDVRAYQYGDDIRTIDWNVSAKGHGTFVKTFREEKEQNILFILDVSASLEIGRKVQKLDIGKEICGILSISAVKESAHVGLVCFTDEKELYIKPEKGFKHAYNLILNLYKLNPKSLKTDLNKCIRYALTLLKRKTVVILISDFMDENYESNLSALSQKHDLVVIHLSDSREINFPKMGIIPLYDKESKRTIWVNTSSSKFIKEVNKNFEEKRDELESFCRKKGANYVWINTNEEYVSKLVKLFKVRKLKGRHV